MNEPKAEVEQRDDHVSRVDRTAETIGRSRFTCNPVLFDIVHDTPITAIATRTTYSAQTR